MEPRRYRVPEHVEFTRVDGDFVLMDMKKGTYFGLDKVASILWQSLADHGRPEPGQEEVLSKFQVDRPRLERDTDELIRDLEKRGLLEAC
jgi:hypothetical protein